MNPKINKDYLSALLVLILLLILKTSNANAQLSTQNTKAPGSPDFLFGLGVGFNDYGAGVGAEIPIGGKLSFYGNVGLGGWGWKLGGGFNFYTKQTPYNSSFSLGYSMASGLQDFETEMEVTGGGTQTVVLDLNRVGTVNLMYSYNLKVGQSSKFVFSGGYAISVTSEPYVVQTQGVTLSETSEQVLAMLQPGGVIFGIKFMFGI